MVNPRPQQAAPDRQPFARVPHAIGSDRRLSHRQRVLVMALLAEAKNRPTCCPLRKELADYVGTSVESIKRDLAALQALGLIAIRREPRTDANRMTGRTITLRWVVDPRVLDAAPPTLTLVGGSAQSCDPTSAQSCDPTSAQSCDPPLKKGRKKEVNVNGNDPFHSQEGEEQASPPEAPQAPPQAPEPKPAPMAIPGPTTPPAASQAPKITADELFNRLPGNPALVGQAVAVLEVELGDDHSGGFLCNACQAAAADPAELPRLLHARKQGIRAKRDGWGGAAFVKAFRAYVPVAPPAKPAPAPTQNYAVLDKTSFRFYSPDAIWKDAADWVRHWQSQGIQDEAIRGDAARYANRIADKHDFDPGQRADYADRFARAAAMVIDGKPLRAYLAIVDPVAR